MPGTKRGLKKSYSQKAEEARKSSFTNIVNQQEGKCWYCGTPMGGDCTKEHLLAQSLGGTNDYPENNVKACHKDCNISAGHLPVSDKYRLRSIGHDEGREEMFRVAIQMRRADARMAFTANPTKSKAKPKSYWTKIGLNDKPSWWDG